MPNPYNLHCSYVKKRNIPFLPVRNKGKYSDTTIAKKSALYRTFWGTYIYGSECTSWTKRGFDYWTHTSTGLEKHEKIQKHFKAFGDSKDLEF